MGTHMICIVKLICIMIILIIANKRMQSIHKNKKSLKISPRKSISNLNIKLIDVSRISVFI